MVRALSLPQAIDVLAQGLAEQDTGAAHTMGKTHLAWGEGHTLHAVGGLLDGTVGTKTWAHTAGGATPLLILWDSHTGALNAIIEAFALGQLRTAATSGLATRIMAAANASTFAMIGAGKQARAQAAAVAAVRDLDEIRVYSPTPAHREALAADLNALGMARSVQAMSSIEEAVAGAGIITLATRARMPILHRDRVEHGAHINAIGAITPERQEVAQDIFDRCDLVAADDPTAARRLATEFMTHFSDDEAAWAEVVPLSALVAGTPARAPHTDISLFKAMGMGLSDVVLGAAVLRRVRDAGGGRPIPAPQKAMPRLT